MRLSISKLWLLRVSLALALPSSSALAEAKPPADSAGAQEVSQPTVRLNSPEWQTVLDQLFGTPDNGLLDGTTRFEFRAEDIALTLDQSHAFFTLIDSPLGLAALIEAAQDLRGNVRLEGTIDGSPFALKLAGRELKLEGLTLTEAQQQALVSELNGISGLKEMKIQALVDGRLTVTKVQGNHEKLEIRNGVGSDLREQQQNRMVRERPERPERERPEKVQIERPAKIEKLERIERIEKPERPERGESGRR